MPVRLKRHEETALKLALWLKARPEVARVLHPALEDDPGHAIWKRDFQGSTGLFGVVFKPMPKGALAVFIDGLTQFGIGYSWGGYESLIVPAHITRTASTFGVDGPVIRIHAGLEDADDLIADLAVGFERIASVT
jgi:cystathionine beta-lyase